MVFYIQLKPSCWICVLSMILNLTVPFFKRTFALKKHFVKPNIAVIFWSLTCHMQECLFLFCYLHVIKSRSPLTESEFHPVVFENAKLQILHLILILFLTKFQMDFQIEDIILKSIDGEVVFPPSPPFLYSPVLFPGTSTCRTSGMASSPGVKITSFLSQWPRPRP